MNEIIEMLKKNGYTVYASKSRDNTLSHETTGYVFAVSPSDNILYIQRGYFGGWEISLQYQPSKKNGSGCRTNDLQPYNDVTIEVMKEAERENLSYARQLHATLYESIEDWKRGYWAELVQL